MAKVQKPQIPPFGFSGPSLTADRLISFDGAQLGLTVWSAEGAPRFIVIGLHGVNDYARTFEGAGPFWAAQGITTYAYDARGHGRSPQRGVWGGEALMTQDLRAAVTAVRARHPETPIALVGESMGAATIMAAVTSKQGLHGVDRLVLVAPAVWGWSNQPLAYRMALWSATFAAPKQRLTPPKAITKRIRASDNVEMLQALGRDPLMIFQTRVDSVYGLVNLMETATHSAGKLPDPTLILYGTNDQIVPRRAVERTVARIPATVRTAEYPDGWHMMLRDRQAEKIWTDIAAFIADPTAPLPSGTGPIATRQPRKGKN
jgi:acylglycerol lipase